MGLEKHVAGVIEEKDPKLMGTFRFAFGELKVNSISNARKIVKILNDSGEFGHATYIQMMDDVDDIRINIDTHISFLQPQKRRMTEVIQKMIKEGLNQNEIRDVFEKSITECV